MRVAPVDFWRPPPDGLPSAPFGRGRRVEMRKTPPMAKRKRTYKLSWRSKKANHGRKPCRGRDKKWH